MECAGCFGYDFNIESGVWWCKVTNTPIPLERFRDVESNGCPVSIDKSLPGFKISEDIFVGLVKYYAHRKAHNEGYVKSQETGEPYPEWDKEHDIEVIFKACSEGGWDASAIAGTFWLQKFVPGTQTEIIIRLDEETFVEGGEVKIKRESDGTPDGLNILADALQRHAEKFGTTPMMILTRPEHKSEIISEKPKKERTRFESLDIV